MLIMPVLRVVVLVGGDDAACWASMCRFLRGDEIVGACLGCVLLRWLSVEGWPQRVYARPLRVLMKKEGGGGGW